MPSALPAVQLLPRPSSGRTFDLRTTVRLGDVDRRNRMRLDATARLLQDVATDDATEARLDRRFGWLVRRTQIDTVRAARTSEVVTATTWCSGIGPAWAERRTSVVGDRGASIESVSLWVLVDSETARPARIPADFHDRYGEAAAGRSVSGRLSIPEAPRPVDRGDDVEVGEWHLRSTDIDPWGHLNNAAAWAVVEERCDLGRPGGREGRAEMEYLLPVEPTGRPVDVTVERGGGATTLRLGRGGAVSIAARWTPSVSSAAPTG